MAQDSPPAVLGQVASLYRVGSAAGLSDGHLLDRFRDGTADEAEAAFAALVERHAEMVLHACRRVLRDRHDAEDAAQATFLVLARQARSVRRGDSLASWLYGVAGRVSARTRREAERRRGRERRHAEATAASASAGDDPRARDAARELHEELGRLPERFRLPIILFHLEGLTYEEVAGRIGCPVRTVQSRLDRGRRRLGERLSRRGLALSGGAITAALVPDVPAVGAEGWKRITARAALRPAAGGTDAAVSTKVSALARGVSKAMNLHRSLRWVVFSLVGATAGGVVWAGFAPALPTPPTPPTPPVARPAQVPADRYRAAFGAAVEVVAVSSLPSGPDTWWRPDGTRLAEAPVDRIEAKSGAREGEMARVILVRSVGITKDDFFRWHPVPTWFYQGGRPRRGGEDVPGLEYYEATVPRDLAECGVEVRVAAGEWKTEATNDGRGGFAEFVNGHKFTYGKARAATAHGRPMTVFAVAHNFFGQDRRMVAIGRDGQRHPAVSYSMGSDGDEKWKIDLIDAEFPLPPDQIVAFDVQFRPIEKAEIKGIALQPAH